MKEQNIYDNEIFFEEYNKGRNKLNANDLVEIPQLFDLIGDVKGLDVLNLGCGAGGHDRKLIELGAKSVLGIDLSTKMLELAEKNKTSDKITYKVMSMNDIDKLDKKIDLVVSSLAIHYVEDYDGLCKKIYNVLKDGGKLIFSCGHPMDSCLIRRDHPDNYVVINDRRYYLISDYNNEEKRVSHWHVDGVETYHRTMSHLINGLINAGFTLEKMEESYSSEEAIKQMPKLIEQKDHSYFVYFKVKKN